PTAPLRTSPCLPPRLLMPACFQRLRIVDDLLAALKPRSAFVAIVTLRAPPVCPVCPVCPARRLCRAVSDTRARAGNRRNRGIAYFSCFIRARASDIARHKAHSVRHRPTQALHALAHVPTPY